MTDSWQRRLEQLVDPKMYQNDAMYHMMTSTFRRWLQTAERAMEDEGVNHTVRERVLNRMVYGAPNAADAYERVAVREQMLKQSLMAEVPPSYRIYPFT